MFTTTTAGSSAVEYVPVFVPSDRLADVYQLLLTSRRAVADGELLPEGDEVVPDLDYREWDAVDLSRLACTDSPAIQNVGAILDLLSATPEEWFSTEQLSEETGVSKASLKGSLSALTRHLRAHYGDPAWPFYCSWGPSIGIIDGFPQTHYRVTSDVAQVWRQVRADAADGQG